MMINLVIRFMIGCDYCAEWYHGSCVGVTAEDAKKIDAYRCPKCVLALDFVATFHIYLS